MLDAIRPNRWTKTTGFLRRRKVTNQAQMNQDLWSITLISTVVGGLVTTCLVVKETVAETVANRKAKKLEEAQVNEENKNKKTA